MLDGTIGQPAHIALVNALLANGALIHTIKDRGVLLSEDFMDCRIYFQTALDQRAALISGSQSAMELHVSFRLIL